MDHAAELPDALADAAAEQLLAAGPDGRGPVLAALVAAHPRHAAALQQLAQELAAADRLLERALPASTTSSPPSPPSVIGGHRVVRTLGEGAFGVVYLCEQEHPVVRRIAVKVLRPGVGDEKTLRRFAAEGQVLAQLNHPAITHVFDAGSLPDGRPFFVMEFVDGLPFRRYCEQRGLDCRARLQLFVAVCRGIAHAHRRGIVHRDLKPANVLVVDSDAGPEPKIIDFGIAKLLEPTTGRGTSRTDAGRVIGTPGYMSPEQAAGDAGSVDARADVFALGVMLYEVLTGELPWPVGTGSTGGSERDPVRPSARVLGSGRAGVSIAELRGDLDWITLHALAHERGERYGSAEELAVDIERHLQGHTVSVGPPSLAYRLRKLCRRHRATVVAVATTLLVTAIGWGLAFAHGRDAKARAEAAQREVETGVEQMTGLAERLLARANDPSLREAPRSDAARQVLLQEARATYEQFLLARPSDPRLLAGRARALLALSHLHHLLGEATAAGDTADAAAHDAQVLLSAAPDDPERRALSAGALRRQGNARALGRDRGTAHGRYLAAVELLAPCAAADPARYGVEFAAARRQVAQTLPEGQEQQAIAQLRTVVADLERLRASVSAKSPWAGEYIETCCELAEFLRLQNEHEAGYAQLGRAAEVVSEVAADRAVRQVLLLRRQAASAWALRDTPGRAEAALQHARQAIEIATGWCAEQPRQCQPRAQLAAALSQLAYLQNYREDFAGSTVNFRAAIASHDDMVARFPTDATRRSGLARELFAYAGVLLDRFRQCDLDEASTCAARAVAVEAQLVAAGQPPLRPGWRSLALCAVIERARERGQVDAACGALAHALAEDPPATTGNAKDELLGAWIALAQWQCDAGQDTAAASWLAKARALVDAEHPIHGKRGIEVGWLEARLAARRGEHAECAAAAARVDAARRSWLATRRASDCLFLAWQCAPADLPVAAEYRAQALAGYDRAILTLDPDVATEPEDPWFVLPWGFMRIRSAQLAVAGGDPVTAREHLAKAMPLLTAALPKCHRDQWDAAAFADGVALQERLAAGR